MGTAQFVVVNGGNCPSDNVIDTEATCREAGSQLGMSFYAAGTSSTDPAGCWIHINDHVHFNTILDPSSTSPSSGKAGLCIGTEYRVILHLLSCINSFLSKSFLHHYFSFPYLAEMTTTTVPGKYSSVYVKVKKRSADS